MYCYNICDFCQQTQRRFSIESAGEKMLDRPGGLPAREHVDQAGGDGGDLLGALEELGRVEEAQSAYAEALAIYEELLVTSGDRPDVLVAGGGSRRAAYRRDATLLPPLDARRRRDRGG